MTDETTQAAAPAEPIVDTVIEYDAPEAAPKDDKPEPTEQAKPEGEDTEGEKADNQDKPEGEVEAEEEAKPKKLSGAQRSKLREARLQAEIDALRAQVAPRGDEDKPPKEEDFNGDFFAYQTAKTVYEVKKALRDERLSEVQTRQRIVQHQELSEMASEHTDREEAIRKIYTDYDAVVGACPVQPSQAVGIEILSSEKSAEIAYFLGKNPGKLQAMNSMTPRELAREMGRLEATVRLPSPKKQTTAPPPLTAVRGGASPSSPDRDLDAWLKKTYG